ncbi:MAG: transposase [Chloroflexi bacterium]|nr:transposase [Chloroflexota bacterium]
MQDEIITFYVVCDDYLKAMHYRDDPQSTMSTAEVMTTALVAARCFKNCLEHARTVLQEEGWMLGMLSASRLNRRLYAIPEGLWLGLSRALAEVHQALNDGQEYAVDSMPLAVCDNYRIRRCQLYRGEAFRGYIASKQRYFYGLRLHVVVTADGHPIEVVLAPGADADIAAFKRLLLDLPDDATVYGDKAYTDYMCEEVLNEDTPLTWVSLHKRNSQSARCRGGWRISVNMCASASRPRSVRSRIALPNAFMPSRRAGSNSKPFWLSWPVRSAARWQVRLR